MNRLLSDERETHFASRMFGFACAVNIGHRGTGGKRLVLTGIPLLQGKPPTSHTGACPALLFPLYT